MLEKYREYCEEVTIETIARSMGARPQIRPRLEDDALEREFAIVVSVDLEGPVTLRLVNAYSYEIAVRITQTMLSMHGEKPTRFMIIDCVGELTNMIAGSCKRKLDMELKPATPIIRLNKQPGERVTRDDSTAVLAYELFGECFLQILTELCPAARV